MDRIKIANLVLLQLVEQKLGNNAKVAELEAKITTEKNKTPKGK